MVTGPWIITGMEVVELGVGGGSTVSSSERSDSSSEISIMSPFGQQSASRPISILDLQVHFLFLGTRNVPPCALDAPPAWPVDTPVSSPVTTTLSFAPTGVALVGSVFLFSFSSRAARPTSSRCCSAVFMITFRSSSIVRPDMMSVSRALTRSGDMLEIAKQCC